MVSNASEDEVKQEINEGSDTLLLKAFLRVLGELREEKNGHCCSELPYVMVSRTTLIEYLMMKFGANWAADTAGPGVGGDEDVASVLERCIDELYELVEDAIQDSIDHDYLDRIYGILHSFYERVLKELTGKAKVLNRYVASTLLRVQIALERPLDVEEVVNHLIEFDRHENSSFRWMSFMDDFLTELNPSTKDLIVQALRNKCADNPDAKLKCQNLFRWASPNVCRVLFKALYPCLTDDAWRNEEHEIDDFDLLAFAREGEELYFDTELSSLFILFSLVASQSLSEGDERLSTHYKNVVRCLSEYVAALLLYYADMLERISGSARLRMALLKLTSLLELRIQDYDSIAKIKALCGDCFGAISDDSGNALPVGDEGNLFLAIVYSRMARCVLPMGIARAKNAELIYKSYASAAKFYEAAYCSIINFDASPSYYSGSDSPFKVILDRKSIVEICARLSNIFSQLLAELTYDLLNRRKATALTDAEHDLVSSAIKICGEYLNVLGDNAEIADLPFLDYAKAVEAIENTIDKKVDETGVIDSYTVCYVLIHDLNRVSRRSRHITEYESRGLFKPLFDWADKGADRLCRILSNSWPSCEDSILELAKEVKEGIHELLSRKNSHGEGKLLYYCSLQNMLYLFDDMRCVGKGRGRHAVKDSDSWQLDSEEDEHINCFTVMNANYMNDPTEGRTLLEYIMDANGEILGEDSEVFRNRVISDRLVFVKSLTSMEDKLYMWSLYGSSSSNRQCDGCCVEIDPVTFQGIEGSPERFVFLRRYHPARKDTQLFAWPLWHKNLSNLWDGEEQRNVLREVFYLRKTKVAESRRSVFLVLSRTDLRLTRLLKNGIKLLSIELSTVRKHCPETSEVVKKLLAEQLTPIAFLYKDGSYATECERRLILIYDTDADSLAAIRELPLGDAGTPRWLCVNPAFPIYIKSITFGSNVSKVEEWIPYVRYLLGKMKIRAKKRGIEIDPEIKFSKIPIR